ncbi:MAG: KEOPS complex subunit Pcc1 [Candidatus Bathyarchaeia archaeon]|nr:hypothetical protein [Candidatus Bathyarchaeota archaeon]
MRAEVNVTLVYESEEEAASIRDGVSPDNLDAPKGLFIDTWASGKSVITYISYEGDNLATLLSTIDDLLSCVAMAEKAILAVKKIQKIF